MVGLAVVWAALAAACGDSDEGDDDDNDATGGTGGTNIVGGNGGTSSGTAGSGNTPTGTPTGGGGSGACGHAGEAEPSGMEGMTAAHNAVRCAVGASPALPPLQWSSSVASVAQSWADSLAGQGCPLQHSGGPYGENIYWTSASSQPSDVVNSWASEQSCFSYTTFPDCCSCTCGHYTQLVWRASTYLGCGMANCPGGGQMWVCNYDPPGNYMGQMPY